MGKKYKKRKKKAHRNPPLSGLDKAIYTVFSILYIIMSCASVVGWILLPRWIAFQDPTVIASKERFIHYLAIAPFFLFVFLFGIIKINDCFEGGKPIFGNKTIRYGEYPWKNDIFPMFGPQHRNVVRKPGEQRYRARVICILLTIFAVTVLIGCLGIYGRICLRDDRTIVTYNSLNKPGEPISIARDCDRITIKAETETTSSGLRSWHYGVIFSCENGEKYEFNNVSFDTPHRGHTGCLRQLLAIKALFSADQITIEREDLLPKVIDYNELDEAQAALLYQLFGPPQ